jgi:hypothetical protein
MLDLSLFRIPAFVGLSIVAFTLAASIFAMFLYLTLYIQDNLGYGPFAAGLRFLPLSLLIFVVAFIAGRLTVRIQSRVLFGIGMLLVTGGLLLMGRTEPTSGWTVLLPGFIVCGIGVGTVNPVLASGAVSVVQPQRSGMASGANNTFRQVGIATGIAVLGAVFQSQIVSHTRAALTGTSGGAAVLHQGGGALRSAMTSGEVREVASSLPSSAARQTLIDAYHVGFSTTLNHLMWLGAAVSFVGTVAGVVLVRQRDFVVPSAPPSPAAPGTSAPAGEGAADDVVPAAHA